MYKRVIAATFIALPLSALAVPGAYIQGNIGGTLAGQTDNPGKVLLFDTGTGFSAGAAAGYLWGDNNFNYGLQFGSLFYPHLADKNFGDLHINVETEGYDLDLLGVLQYTFPSNFQILTKLGAAYLNQKFTIENQTSASQTAIAPELALGVGYQFDSNFAAGLTFSDVFAGDPSNKIVIDPKASDTVATQSILLNLTYTFDNGSNGTPQLLGD